MIWIVVWLILGPAWFATASSPSAVAVDGPPGKPEPEPKPAEDKTWIEANVEDKIKSPTAGEAIKEQIDAEEKAADDAADNAEADKALAAINAAITENCQKAFETACNDDVQCKGEEAEKGEHGSSGHSGGARVCKKGKCACDGDFCRVASKCIKVADIGKVVMESRHKGIVDVVQPVDMLVDVNQDGSAVVNSRPCYPLQSRPMLFYFYKVAAKLKFGVQMEKASSCEKTGFTLDDRSRIVMGPELESGYETMVTKYNTRILTGGSGNTIEQGDKLLQVCNLEPPKCAKTSEEIGRMLRFQDEVGSATEGKLLPSCVNQDSGTQDNHGDGCDWYDKAVGKLGSAQICGRFDHKDFIASELCCACKRGK